MDPQDASNPAVNPKAAEALAAAEKLFIIEGLRKTLTARVANRFFINVEGDKISLVIGGIGTMVVGIEGVEMPEDVQPMPITEVIEVFRVELSFLRRLVEVINGLFPPETEGEKPEAVSDASV